MHNFKKDLLAVINDHREELIYRICNRLQGLPSSHYELIDYSSHQEREEEFMDILLQAFTDGNYHSFISYMEELASTRSNEGYSLDEVQKAINIIQDELTNIFITHLNLPKDVVKTLLSFFRGFGIAKDHAATIYLKEAIETQKELETLKQKFYAYRHDRKDHSNNKEP